MPIVPSRSKQIQEWIAALSAPRAAKRESAIARLTLLGERAVGPLSDALRTAPAAARPAAAEALLRLSGAGSAAARTVLAEALSDPALDESVRLLALEAVGELAEPAGVEVDPLAEAETFLASAPEGPEAIPALHRLLGGLGPQAEDPRSAEMAVRLHEALAARGSRIALYDLRERLEARPPRDVLRLLEVAGQVADASFVPTLARLAADALPLVPACAAVLRAIVRRERLKKSHRSVKAVRAEHQAVFESLWSRAKR
jgi:hypothetical protein